ncbi:16S rRNA (guanine(966)-N(2))-methyltransferase RsmD [Halomonas denitrificans]|uniref:16S rRNA (guanine(966)-N(2))-methyltransferase RsmD n=1 Tax=Halomonas denitrificans TaxID=370769 RepID=UPI001C99FA8C|nr:16S rRNA (guanine(966)-N(2))-methyltransferase RsmD [Halomonas denitrificans]MBY5970112.1 16S rRNA (guanine(966)-N(2))-methyltransferase RsmD [Halomonas denitrificans]
MSRHRPSRPRPRPGAKTAATGRAPGKLRIIGGDHRRRLLPVLDKPGLRPTPDRVRETLFNWLGGTLYGKRVLDLFAGTGALGLEALSRGARAATFVERDGQVAKAINDNLATLSISSAEVITQDTLTMLSKPPEVPFDIAFIDPPFRQALAEPCCAALEQGWLTDDAWIYVEVESGLELSVPEHWHLHREVKAGDSFGRLYRRHTTSS